MFGNSYGTSEKRLSRTTLIVMFSVILLELICSSDARRGHKGNLPTDANIELENSSPTSRASATSSYVRVNSVGFGISEPKTAVLMSSASWSSAFAYYSVMDAYDGETYYLDEVPVSTPSQSWSSSFSYTYQLDFSFLSRPSTYYITIHQLTVSAGVNTYPIVARSTTFDITANMSGFYSNLLSNSLFYFRAQRDGPNVDPTVMNRKPSHLADQSAIVYQVPTFKDDSVTGSLTPTSTIVDVTGGWFDAGDYLKFAQTSTYCMNLMMLAYRDYHTSLPSSTSAYLLAEIKHGLEWAIKTWDNTHGILYYQVGLGMVNNNQYGDHDVWRLPEADDALNVSPTSTKYYVKYRPVFATGSSSANSLSPNLAGRLSAEFALCYQIFKATNSTLASLCLTYAQRVYSLAQTNPAPSKLISAAPFDFYPETEWADDMSFAGVQLYLATGTTSYLTQASSYLKTYINNNDYDSINLYDISGVAQYELWKVMQTPAASGLNFAVSLSSLISFLKTQVSSAITVANGDAFRFAAKYNSGLDLVPEAFGIWLQASFYSEMIGSSASTVEVQQRDWLFGKNAWGASMIVGAGSNYAHCMQHQVANLVGSLTGGPSNILLGATYDGPSQTGNFQGLGIPSGAKNCPSPNVDAYTSFTGQGVRYFDNVQSWPSVEPADDYTVTGLYVFARMAALHANELK